MIALIKEKEEVGGEDEVRKLDDEDDEFESSFDMFVGWCIIEK